MNANMPMTEIPDYRARYYDPNIGRITSEELLRFLAKRSTIRDGMKQIDT
jgi:hypothetical protein